MKRESFEAAGRGLLYSEDPQLYLDARLVDAASCNSLPRYSLEDSLGFY